MYRIKFGKAAKKCSDCKATCHPQCSDKVPLPCVPFQGTPMKQGRVIADFVNPKVQPMVPAIVVHLCNEIEARGLTEVGIYRVPGAEKDVIELKVLLLSSMQ